MRRRRLREPAALRQADAAERGPPTRKNAFAKRLSFASNVS